MGLVGCMGLKCLVLRGWRIAWFSDLFAANLVAMIYALLK